MSQIILKPQPYDVGKVKMFMKHIVLSSQREGIRSEQKQKLGKQIAKVRKLSLDRAPKVKIGKEWDKMEDAIDLLVSSNKTLVSVEQNNSTLLKKALDKIEKLSSSLSNMEDFASTRKKLSEDRMRELSNKVRSRFSQKDIDLMEKGLEKVRSPTTSAEIDAIEAQLTLLEKKHAELKKSGAHSPEDLNRIEGMIKDSKAKLKVMKY